VLRSKSSKIGELIERRCRSVSSNQVPHLPKRDKADTRSAEDRPPPNAASPVPDVDAPPDLFAAMQQQLGLKMGTTKAAVDVMVIENVDKPNENQTHGARTLAAAWETR
jgi:hypothetical protein